MRRMVVAVLAAVALAGLAAFVTPAAQATSWTPSSYASRLVTLLNQARAQHGLPGLSVASGTSEVAAGWTSHLAASQALSHNPDLAHDLETHGSPDWTSYGENVGEGPATDPDALFRAYMNSTEHRTNILSASYRYMGVGVVFTGSTAWNTFDFVDTYHAPKSTATAPKPKPTTQAPATTTTVHTTSTYAAAAPAAVTHPVAAHPVVRGAPRVARRHPQRLRVAGLRGRSTPVSSLVPLLSGGSTSAGVVALPPLPRPTSPTSQLVIAVAGALVGFLGTRWLQVARGT